MKRARRRAVKDPEHDFHKRMSAVSVSEWLDLSSASITEESIKRYPNAKKAAEIKASPLIKALK